MNKRCRWGRIGSTCSPQTLVPLYLSQHFLNITTDTFNNPFLCRLAALTHEWFMNVFVNKTEENDDVRKGEARGLYIPCPDDYKNYCVHGECQFPRTPDKPSCRYTHTHDCVCICYVLKYKYYTSLFLNRWYDVVIFEQLCWNESVNDVILKKNHSTTSNSTVVH